MTPTATDPVTDRIAHDIVAGAPFSAYPPADGVPRSLAQGYALQDAVAAALQASGARGAIAGYKIAVNSPELMAHFRIEEPASGQVFADQTHEGHARLPAAGFAEFAYEPEIAAVMGRALPLKDAPFTREAVAAAIAGFVPALELLDTRGARTRELHLPDVVAQNISNAGAVLGGPGVAPDALEPGAIRTVVTLDGAPELDVTGAAPQDPLDAVCWLANHLAARGRTLEAGDFILCGTHAPLRLMPGPVRIEVTMSGLGTVGVELS